MECCYESAGLEESADPSRKIIRHSSTYQPKLSSWFDLRVFYVRVSNFEVDQSTPEYLTLNHIPLSPDTLLEGNGGRSSIYSEGVSSLLRRDRVDKKAEEATFVSTDSVRMTGSVKFEVYDKDDLLLSGVLEMYNSNGCVGESKNHSKRWSMNCQSVMTVGTGFLRGKQNMCSELLSPTVEVYVAGCFLGTPIILTKTLQLSFRRKHNRKGTLDSIPEYETTESKKDVQSNLAMQVYRDYKQESDDEEYNSLYSRAEYIESEDGELSWFNAGVRVGVGIGLGICLGIGIGVGLLVRTYQTTTRNFKRRLV
ncbi:erythronate-4-phosphate dehydrogenase family protein [Tasmannia lanceolata]|uniref:erythronate-4-phosphate dehydrogenase family protein n=1 Tax=Tasmannia lanceolata TaxID=3420 RepID=UPI0040647ACB